MISGRRAVRTSLHLLWAGMAVATIVLSGGMSALAQNASPQEMLNRIDRLQNEITTLQRYVYQGKAPPAAASAPVPLQAGSTASSLSARQSLRLTQLEREIQRLTGINEELVHRLDQALARLDKMASDTEFRLKTLEGGGAKVGAAAGGQQPPGTGLSSAAPGSPVTAVPEPVENTDKGAKLLGAIRDDAPAASASAALVETPEQQYDRAHGLIIKTRDYAQAEKVLSAFIADHPKHQLAANAYYWLGRTYFVRKDFQNSVTTFAEGFQKHSDSKKAPAILLNLGMSLARLGKQREACTTFAHLQRNFPGADGVVKRRMAAERKTAKCGG